MGRNSGGNRGKSQNARTQYDIASKSTTWFGKSEYNGYKDGAPRAFKDIISKEDIRSVAVEVEKYYNEHFVEGEMFIKNYSEERDIKRALKDTIRNIEKKVDVHDSNKVKLAADFISEQKFESPYEYYLFKGMKSRNKVLEIKNETKRILSSILIGSDKRKQKNKK